MQAEISSARVLTAQDNVLIPGTSLTKIRKRYDIIADAQAIARKIIKDAVQESDDIRNESYQIGYERGVLMSIDSICQFIDDSNRHTNELYLQIQKDIQDLLTEVLDDEAIVLKVLDGWVDELDMDDKGAPLCILMPYANRKFKPNMMKMIENKYPGESIFEYHHEHRFVFKYKDRLAEFYPEEFIGTAMNTLTGSRDFHSKNQLISAEAIKHLHQQLALYYPADDEGVEELNETSEVADDEY